LQPDSVTPISAALDAAPVEPESYAPGIPESTLLDDTEPV